MGVSAGETLLLLLRLLLDASSWSLGGRLLGVRKPFGVVVGLEFDAAAARWGGHAAGIERVRWLLVVVLWCLLLVLWLVLLLIRRRR